MLLLAAGVAWSLGGLLIKSIDLPPLAVSSARSLIAAAALLAIFGRNARFSFSVHQLAGAAAYAGCVTLFVVSNKLTTAANAIFLQYTSPLYVALFGIPYLGEKPSRTDLACLLAIFIGMGVFFLEDLSPGGFWGNIAALGSGICFAWITLTLRKQKDDSPISSVILGNLIAGALGLPALASSLSGGTVSLDAAGLAALLTLGLVQMALPYALLSIAIKTVTAIEAQIMPMIEPVLSPVWVFIMLGEKPSVQALLGGAIILAAVIAKGALSARADPQPS